MSSSYDIAKTAFSRVFLIKGRARADRAPEYQSCMKAGGVEQGFGDIERIECPDEANYGQFKEVGTIQGAVERATSSLMGRYASDMASELLELAKQRCAADVQVHFGKCTDPRVFNTFTKALVWEDVHLPSYSTEDLGALSSDENAPVMETSDLSIGTFYEVLQLTFQERAPDTVTNELVDAVICDQISCGDCEDYSTGCNKVFMLQGGQTGSPGTPPDVIYSSNKGKTWASDEVFTLTSAQTADAIACFDDYVLVFSDPAGSYSYKLKATILAGTPGGWTEVTTGFAAGGAPQDAWGIGVGVFVVGNGGYTYWLDDVASGVTVLDAGVATSNSLNAVHALSDEIAVAVGASDTVIFTTNRYSWAAANPTGGGNDLQAVWMRSEDEWWVGDSAGNVYVTYDQGDTWTAVSLPGSGITAIYDIQFPTDSVGYIAGVAGSSGAIWRTYNAGYSWVRLPEGYGSLPGSSSQINAIATCEYDVNFVTVAAQDAANDGVLLTGED